MPGKSVKIFFVVFSILVITIGGFLTTLTSNATKTQSERNVDIEGYGLAVLLCGVIPLALFVCSFGIQFFYPSYIKNLRSFWKIIVAAVTICILLTVIGSVIISYKTDDSKTSDGKNSSYVIMAVTLTSMGVGMLALNFKP